MVDKSGKHWYGTGDIDRIDNMFLRLAGLGLYKEVCFSQSLGDNLGIEGSPQCNFRIDDYDVKAALEAGRAFSEKDFGPGKLGAAMKNIYAANYAHALRLVARTPMENYASPDPGFNTFLKKCPAMVVIADVLDHFEKLGMELKFKPTGDLEPLMPSKIMDLTPEMIKDFMEQYGGCKANIKESSIYATLSYNKKNIHWIKPTVEQNGENSCVNHYFYSPQSNGLKFLDFVNLFVALENVVPVSQSPRDSYLRKAEEMAPEWFKFY